MNPHTPPPAGAVRTRVLVLLIVLIVCGVIGAVIVSHFLMRDETPAANSTASADLASSDGLPINRFAHRYI